jgi:hypothetical protein
MVPKQRMEVLPPDCNGQPPYCWDFPQQPQPAAQPPTDDDADDAAGRHPPPPPPPGPGPEDAGRTPPHTGDEERSPEDIADDRMQYGGKRTASVLKDDGAVATTSDATTAEPLTKKPRMRRQHAMTKTVSPKTAKKMQQDRIPTDVELDPEDPHSEARAMLSKWSADHRPLGLNFFTCGPLHGMTSSDNNIFSRHDIDVLPIVEDYSDEGKLKAESESRHEEKAPIIHKTSYLYDVIKLEFIEPDTNEEYVIEVTGYGVLMMLRDYFFLPVTLRKILDKIIDGDYDRDIVYSLMCHEFNYVFYPNQTVYHFIAGFQTFLKHCEEQEERDKAKNYQTTNFIKLLKQYNSSWTKELRKLEHNETAVLLNNVIEVHIPPEYPRRKETVLQNIKAISVVRAIENYSYSSDLAKNYALMIGRAITKQQAVPLVEKLLTIDWETEKPLHAVRPLLEMMRHDVSA